MALGLPSFRKSTLIAYNLAMATHSSIEWTTRTWNPLVGCSMISPGCAHCYAERMSARLAKMAQGEQTPGRKQHYMEVINDRGRWNNHIQIVDEAMDDPLHWKQPSTIFVNSMSDLFHEDVPVEFIQRVFSVMAKARWHQFQVLTKRAERLEEVAPFLMWSPNIWQGVSIEGHAYEFRVGHLRRTSAAIKFLSVEPLLGPVSNLPLEGLDWIIVGGESGPGCRPMLLEWVRELCNRCVDAGVPFFFKQWGHIRNNPDPLDPTAKQNGGTAKGGRMLDGRIWDQMPKPKLTAISP